MSILHTDRLISITLLSIIAICALTLSGCTTSQLPPVRAELPLGSEDKVLPEESRRLENLPAGEVLQLGHQALGNGDHQLASVYYRTVLNKDPASTPARLGLAQTTLETGDYNAAKTLLDAILRVDPDSVPALMMRGRTLRELGKLDAAIADFSHSREKAPNNSAVLTELAMTFDRIPERISEAEPLYRKVLELSPDSASARNNLGFNFLLQGRAEEAATILSGALALDAKNSRILANLATAYLLLGNKNKALQLFKQTVDEAEAYNNIGYLYMTQSRWDEAETALRKALELRPRYYARAGANLARLQELRIAAREKRN